MAWCKNSYSLPVKRGDIQKVLRKHPLNVGGLENSVDFICKEGTPIYAAAGGRVVWLKNDSAEGGPYKKYWYKGNRLVIKHRCGEYTAYEHLKYRGARVKIGQKVRKGQLIGYSGNTGYSFCPHLHFEVFSNPDKDESEGTTLRVFFKSLKKE